MAILGMAILEVAINGTAHDTYEKSHTADFWSKSMTIINLQFQIALKVLRILGHTVDMTVSILPKNGMTGFM